MTLIDYVKPSKPASTENEGPLFRTPFILPKAGNDEIQIYITAIKKKAPFEYCNIGLIDFAKYVLPKDASSTQNVGKHYPARYLTKLLTKNQCLALRKEIKTRYIDIPAIPNPDFDPRDPEKAVEYFTPYRARLEEWIILKEIENVGDDDLTESPGKHEKESLEDSVNTEIYKNQEKKKRK